MIPGVDQVLEHDEVVRTGSLAIRVLHIPGHTVGQTAYVIDDEVCFTGDTLFRGSIGGTVGPGHATFGELRASILDRLLALPAGTRVAPGHAAPTTIGATAGRADFVTMTSSLDAGGAARAKKSVMLGGSDRTGPSRSQPETAIASNRSTRGRRARMAKSGLESRTSKPD